MTKILFIGHDASLTGAPILLLQLIKWMKMNNNIDASVLLKRGGKLLDDYKTNSTLFVLEDNSKRSIYKSIYNKLGYNRKHKIINSIKKQNFDILFFNTVDTLDLIPLLKQNQKVILYIHELQIAINLFVKNGNISFYDKYIDKYISVSNAVKNNLINNHNIIASKIETIYAFPDIKKIRKSKEDILKEYDIPNDAFIVGNIGRADLGKGVDLFIEIAKFYLKKNINSKFIWVGSIPKEIKEFIQKDFEILNLKNKILFLGQKSNILDYYSIFDIMLFTSREDSFPLVILEAANEGVPILCFNETGGTIEFIEDNINGIICPYGDINCMLNKLDELYLNKDKREKLSINMLEKSKKYTSDRTFGEIYKIINQDLLNL